MIDNAISDLVGYGIAKGFVAPEDAVYTANRVLEVLKLGEYSSPPPESRPLPEILGEILDWAESTGRVSGITERDLLDTAVMGCVTPRPSEVIRRFREDYAVSPAKATDGFYVFCKDVNDIRADRVALDEKWVTPTPYGDLDITINLSKPEKDPKAIAAAKTARQTDYPKCALCRENEGFAGDLTHAARQNHRVIPITLAGEEWYFQYSPYVYYNEHCIVLGHRHVPMKIERATFARLLDFVRQFPEYFIGSNADLPIVGGSILSHDHFQGGKYEFAMARAPVESEIRFHDYPDVAAGVVRWPMTVLRLRCSEAARLVSLADDITMSWREYSDQSAGIFAYSGGEPHNTVTPIARRRGEEYELDLVLRNNITSAEHPLGVFHPHAEHHHIKKENIGLIEVMGLAVLPARLKDEMARLADAMCRGEDYRSDEELRKHADWADAVLRENDVTPDNVHEILRREIGGVFCEVLLQCGVFKRDAAGRSALARFVSAAGGKTAS